MGLDGWQLWQYIGRLTRKAWDLDELGRWRKTLAKRFPRIENFHREIKRGFYRQVGDHLEHDDKRHRLFIDEIVHDGLERVSFVVALAIDEAIPDSLAARFQSWFLCETAKPPKALAEEITEALGTTFSGAMFHVAMAEDVTNL